VTQVLYNASGPVTLVGAAPVAARRLAAALALASEVVAADGGADVVLPEGREFGAVIGDLDSVAGEAALRARGVPVHRIVEQDSTDLEKCLRAVAAPLFLGVGFLGGRIDHQLAALGALVANPDKTVVLIGARDIVFRCPELLSLDLPEGTRVSLFPMGETRGVVSDGLRWPVTGLDFAPAGRIGTSNVALGGPVRVGFDTGRMLVILPARQLRAAATALGALGPVRRRRRRS
jgi:thiamine pyrophosphokinase